MGFKWPFKKSRRAASSSQAGEPPKATITIVTPAGGWYPTGEPISVATVEQVLAARGERLTGTKLTKGEVLARIRQTAANFDPTNRTE